MSIFAGKLSEIIRAVTGDGVDPHKHFNSAIIVAAGNGCEWARTTSRPSR